MLGLLAVAGVAAVLLTAVAYYFTCRTKHKDVTVTTFIRKPTYEVYNFIKEPENMMTVHPSIVHVNVTKRDEDRWGTETLEYTQEERLATFNVKSIAVPKEGRLDTEFTTPSRMFPKSGNGWFKGYGEMLVESTAVDGYGGTLLTWTMHIKTPHMKEKSTENYLYETYNRLLENTRSYLETGEVAMRRAPPPEPEPAPAQPEPDVDAEVAAMTGEQPAGAQSGAQPLEQPLEQPGAITRPDQPPPRPPKAEISKEIDL